MSESRQHPITDEGRRLAAAVDAARLMGGEGRWIAARLSDGGTDGVVYDEREHAVAHQLHEDQCAYLIVPPAPMPPAEATAWIDLHRRMYAAGYRLSDPRQQHAAVPGLGMPNRRARRLAARRNPR